MCLIGGPNNAANCLSVRKMFSWEIQIDLFQTVLFKMIPLVWSKLLLEYI